MKPMKAEDADIDNLHKLPWPLAGLIKYDGVRCLVPDGQLLGRSWKQHANPYLTELFSKPEYAGFDAEGIVGPDNHPRLVSITSGAFSRQKDHKTDPEKVVKVADAKLYVFDDFSHPGTYERRHAQAYDRVFEILQKNAAAPIKIVEYRVLENPEHMLAWEEEVLANGYEGLILRRLDGMYKHGRSTVREAGYLRVKRFEEEEGRVLSVEEGFTNTNEAKKDALGHTERSTRKEGMVPNGEIAALIIEDLKTKEVRKISAGRMTKAEAKEWFEDQSQILGKIVKYKHFNKGVKDKIRFGTFQCIRSEEDM